MEFPHSCGMKYGLHMDYDYKPITKYDAHWSSYSITPN
jgi:hypothetical protein